MNLTQYLTEVKEREKRATAKPWYVTSEWIPHLLGLCGEGVRRTHLRPLNWAVDNGLQAVDDFKFIAHARQNIPTLLKIIEVQAIALARIEACTPFTAHAEQHNNLARQAQADIAKILKHLSPNGDSGEAEDK